VPIITCVSLNELTSAEAVRAAIAEFDALGRDAFLAKYGFGGSRRYFVRLGESMYDSKAIAGAAFGFEHPERGPLQHTDFSGGEETVVRRLRELGFSVEVQTDGGAPARTEDDALHLVVKWSAGRRADTIERHREIAEARGAVWWGLATSGDPDWRIAERWLERLRAQIAAGTPTLVFISGPSCWRTDLLAVVYSREEAEEDLIPAYYSEAGLNQHHLWVKLTNFTPVERQQLLRLLDPERESKRGRPIALGNQTNPLLVRMRTAPRCDGVTWG
jgi:hypothetical protein